MSRAERRERIATAVMAGLCAAIKTSLRQGVGPAFASVAVEFADALIEELDKVEAIQRPPAQVWCSKCQGYHDEPSHDAPAVERS